MGVMRFSLSDELEARLRALAMRKGDLSRIVEEALRAHLGKLEEASG